MIILTMMHWKKSAIVVYQNCPFKMLCDHNNNYYIIIYNKKNALKKNTTQRKK